MSLEAQQVIDLAETAVGESVVPLQDSAGPGPPAVGEHLKNSALKAYTQQTEKARRDERIVELLPMVSRIVHQVVSFLKPPLTKDDLISAGTIGLVKAARDFDPAHDASFKTYAYIRIRGAVLDELRAWSFAPATVKKQLDRAQQIAEQIVQHTGRAPSDEELAERLGIGLEKMYKIFEEARRMHFLSIHSLDDEAPALGSMLAATGTKQPGHGLEQAELAAELAKQIGQLPTKQRRVIVLYYHQELTMKQIAGVLKITESRVSQLHASALFKLSIRLREFDDSRS
ncbi:MAG: FliA/WhiG family RNA polymerase sigma factor [Planctomycetota bacterium]|nr:MAG: FliA/WhiG family RNA polymerase sigma factor [Planctomycetota bacterium]